MSTTTAPPHPDELAQVDRLLAHFDHLEAQLQEVRAGLTESHRLATLGTIATIIAHEYNNILTPMISYAQLALANPDDAALNRKALEKALSGAERAAHISSSLLGFARDEPNQTQANLPTVVDESLACLGRDPKRDGINLTLDIPDVTVAINPLDLQQVLLNLVLNARKAMTRGGALRITGQVNNDHVALDIADTGPGIPDAIRERLFEPFVTHELTDTPAPGSQKGTGLGLCICRDLLTRAGGKINVTSPPGQGATFHLQLPIGG
ncbi:sensor histidine kinase [Phycisphaerales bacterium AB-hyl4]|uniref:histidine kinase n=1 Tax=Natronomicrosphaera hydrolytica TaxID=3242702 RepID=A0ABV4U6T9_9BACT